MSEVSDTAIRSFNKSLDLQVKMTLVTVNDAVGFEFLEVPLHLWMGLEQLTYRLTESLQPMPQGLHWLSVAL